MNGIERRIFVKEGALALMALGLPPDFLLQPLLAGTQGLDRKKTLICIFQRGAVDGLSMVVPFGERGYYDSRRTIAIQAPGSGDGSALDLDGFFGLHPALTPLEELYRRSEMAIVHAVGSPHPTRSHFDAQDFMETGTPGVKSTREGWLNRVLQDTECAECEGRTLQNAAAHAADHAAGQLSMATVSSLRGVSMTSALPRVMQGNHPALAIPNLSEFGVHRDDEVGSAFRRLYRTERGDAVSAAAEEAFEAVRALEAIDPGSYEPTGGAQYPNGDFGRSLREIAQLVKADVGVEIAFADLGGWDTHVRQGGAQGQLAGRLGQLGEGIRALYDDLGDRMEDVVILTMSEFGRTVAENGSGGTDHGHANCMLALGGSVKGGRILGDWPGLERELLYQGRDLAVTTDFRDVFSEVVSGHLGAAHLDRIFPGYDGDPARYRGILG
ncbi:MAG: hypothetical protein CME11_07890 [Gemmatimonadetes bacterium]|jgi:uncharacterized protein (DUF1501 family)|nr:hypothetical protein [Gemmatimonadota bacterium]